MPDLRDYQQRAIKMLYSWLSIHRGNPCIVMPAGSGKSHVISGLCRDILANYPASRILVLSHVKELLEQDADKILRAWPDAPLGIYSAGLGRRELDKTITVAGIQSVRDKAAQIGFVDLVIVDEAHLINHRAEGGYRALLNGLGATNPNLRIVGLTATPYRLGHGLISENGAIFDDIIEPVKIDELVACGFLAPLRSKLPAELLNVDGVGKRGGEYIEHELQAAVNKPDANGRIVDEVMRLANNRRAWLFFCAGVKHSYAMRDTLRSRGIAAETVTGETPKSERDAIIADYRAGRIKALTNADVLTTGFDYPGIDLIAMCRPTMSPGLYVQMAGRGMRTAPGKTDCLVLDFAGNVAMHGPITAVQPPRHENKVKKVYPRVCPRCAEICAPGATTCPNCFYVFEKQERDAPHLKLHNDDIMGSKTNDTSTAMDISSWKWSVQQSRRTGIDMLCVHYYDAYDLCAEPVIEYLTILHDGYAGEKANRTLGYMAECTGVDVAGKSLEEIAEVMNESTAPEKIYCEKDGDFWRISKYIWDVNDEESKSIKQSPAA